MKGRARRSAKSSSVASPPLADTKIHSPQLPSGSVWDEPDPLGGSPPHQTPTCVPGCAR